MRSVFILLIGFFPFALFSGTPGLLTDYAVPASFSKGKGKGLLRNAFLKGQISIHAGAGFINLQYPGHNDYLQYGKVSSEYNLPINARVEYGITSSLSAGAFVNMYKARTDIRDRTASFNVNGFEYKSTTIALTAAYHVYMGKNLVWFDPYVNGMIGLESLKASPFGTANYFEPQEGGMAYSFGFGANFYLFQPLAIYAEAGYGINIFNTGITLRF
jgi:hypothetical protein